jgi:hypothetical protein
MTKSSIGITFYAFIFSIPLIFAQNFQSKYFYLGEITDLRPGEKQNLGMVFMQNNSKLMPFNMPNGHIGYLKNKFNTILKSTVDPYKVNLVLTHFTYTEKPKNEQTVAGAFRFEGNFYLQTSFDSTTIFPFKYTVSYIRKIGEMLPLYTLVDQKVDNLMVKLEAWFAKNYEKNYNLARHIIVNTKDFSPKERDSDTLYFFQRRINFNDFTLKKAAPGRFSATIFTGMGYFANSKMHNDTIYLELTTKVYQVKGMSWAIPEANSTYSLNHEQLHFNITQLIAEKFKQRLREEALPPIDFDSRIQYLYMDYFRQINQLQNRYDNDTDHGLNTQKQAWWENYIAGELKKYDVII